MEPQRPGSVRSLLPPTPVLLAFGLPCLLLFWVYFPVLSGLASSWQHDPRYSHGYCVPLFSAYLLWSRRASIAGVVPAANWWGLPVLLIGLALNAAGTYLYLDWFNSLSLLPTFAGVILLLGGWPALRWSWSAVAFLAFMVPLPFRLEVAMAHPLQRVGTIASTYVLQTLGFAAFSEGNVVRMGTVRLGVVEACSGLSMLVIFFALSTAVAIVVRRPLWERLMLVASAVPIALLCNITRITVTGILHKVAGAEWADYVFHDLAGWLMMPLALGMLWVELKTLAWVVLPRQSVTEAGPVAVYGLAVPNSAGRGH